METDIRCTTCGAELSQTGSVGYYRFLFCKPVSFTDDETCMGQFSNNLWRAAEKARIANQKDHRAPEEETGEAQRNT